MYSQIEAKDFILKQAYVILFNKNSWKQLCIYQKGVTPYAHMEYSCYKIAAIT